MDINSQLQFGIIAVQLGKISNQQLLEAFRFIADSPSKPLADVLSTLYGLTQEDLSVIHSEMHNVLNDTENDGEKTVTLPKTVPSETNPDTEALKAVEETDGRYIHIAKQGSGGMGQVLLVHDKFLMRDIALKELLPGASTGDTEGPSIASREYMNFVARFIQEARITGQLQHPSIVPVYEIGRKRNGTLFYTMKLVRGKTLHEAIEQYTTLEERLTLLPHFLDVCQAIAYAHSRRVIHRDIKPKNIMIGEFGETVVLDWGISKSLDEDEESVEESIDSYRDTIQALNLSNYTDTPKTHHGQIVGTPAFMSPEQAQGKRDEINTYSDVFSLGSLLYTLLSGKRPFHGEEIGGVLNKVAQAKPIPLDQHNNQIPAELITICEQAMQKKPENRYASAIELTDDIQRFMSGALVAAHSYSLRDHLKRYILKHKAVVTLIIVSVFLLVGVGVFYNLRLIESRNNEMAQRKVAEQSQAEAEVARDKERTAREEADYELYLANISIAKAAYTNRRFTEARERLEAIPIEQRHWEWGLLYHMNSPHRLSITIPAGIIRDIDYALDDQYLLIASVLDDIYIYDAWTGELVNTLKTSPLYNLHTFYTPNGKHIISLALNPKTHDAVNETIWDWKTGTKELVLNEPLAGQIAVRKDSQQMAISYESGVIKLFDITTGISKVSMKGHTAPVFDLAYGFDGSWLVSVSRDDQAIRLWSTTSGEQLHMINVEGPFINNVATHPTKPLVVFGGEYGALKLWNAETKEEVAILEGHTAEIKRIMFTHEGNRIVTSSDDRTIRVWDTNTFEQLHLLDGYTLPLRYAGVSHDGDWVATLDSYDTATIRSLHPKPPLRRLEGHSGGVNSVAFSPDGKIVASAGGHWKLWDDDRVILWDVETGVQLGELKGNSKAACDLVFSNDGTKLYVTRIGVGVVVWDVATQMITEEISIDEAQLPHSAVYRLSLSPNGRYLAIGGWEMKNVVLWDLENKTVAHRLSGHTQALDGLSFSPDGYYLATINRDGFLRVWHVQSGALIHKIQITANSDVWLSSCAFSPDGKEITIGAEKGILETWDWKNETLIYKYPRQASRTEGVVYSLDGKRMFTTYKDGTLKVWDTQTKRELLAFREHTAAVRKLAISPDGRTIATPSYDKSVLLWPTADWE